MLHGYVMCHILLLIRTLTGSGLLLWNLRLLLLLLLGLLMLLSLLLSLLLLSVLRLLLLLNLLLLCRMLLSLLLAHVLHLLKLEDLMRREAVGRKCLAVLHLRKLLRSDPLRMTWTTSDIHSVRLLLLLLLLLLCEQPLLHHLLLSYLLLHGQLGILRHGLLHLLLLLLLVHELGLWGQMTNGHGIGAWSTHALTQHTHRSSTLTTQTARHSSSARLHSHHCISLRHMRITGPRDSRRHVHGLSHRLTPSRRHTWMSMLHSWWHSRWMRRESSHHLNVALAIRSRYCSPVNHSVASCRALYGRQYILRNR